MKSTFGLLLIIIVFVIVPLDPWLLVTFNFTWYVPGFLNTCDGFSTEEVVASPKSHSHLVNVPIVFTEVLIKFRVASTQAFVE